MLVFHDLEMAGIISLQSNLLFFSSKLKLVFKSFCDIILPSSWKS